MARYLGPRGKLERRESFDLGLFSGIVDRGNKFKTSPPGGKVQRRGRTSNYDFQLRAKQLVKRMYGMLERQFRIFFSRATRSQEPTVEAFNRLLESRLDNVVYRLGFARTRAEARQLVNHRIIFVKRRDWKGIVSIPSFQVEPGCEVSVRERSRNQKRILESIAMPRSGIIPPWLAVDEEDRFLCHVSSFPNFSDVSEEFQAKLLLIVELYSR